MDEEAVGPGGTREGGKPSDAQCELRRQLLNYAKLSFGVEASHNVAVFGRSGKTLVVLRQLGLRRGVIGDEPGVFDDGIWLPGPVFVTSAAELLQHVTKLVACSVGMLAGAGLLSG